MKTIEVEVINRLGLHARPAAKLTQKANEFLSEIKIDKDGRVVNGKSIMGVMLLAASKGTVLKISADGTDEESALQQLKELFDINIFGSYRIARHLQGRSLHHSGVPEPNTARHTHAS